MTYDPHTPDDKIRRVDPNARRLETEQTLRQPEPVRKSTSATPWLILIGLLVVAGLIWMQVGNSPTDASRTSAPAPTTSSETTPPPAAAPPPVTTAPEPPVTTTPPAADAPATQP